MKVYIIRRFELTNGCERIVKVYSEKNKEVAKQVVDRLNNAVSEDANLQYSLDSYLVDAEDCYD
jgi:hypothetical protein